MYSVNVQHKKLFRRRGMSGQILVMFSFGLLFVFLVLGGLGTDVAGMYRARSHQRQALELTEDALFADGNSIKFSSVPSQDVFDSVKEVLRDNSYTGTVECIYYEFPQGYSADGDTLPSDYRVAGIYLKMSETYTTSFIRIAGVETVDLAQENAFCFSFYSDSNTVWRPSTVGGGTRIVWNFKNGVSSTLTSTGITLGSDSFPRVLLNEMQTTLSEISS